MTPSEIAAMPDRELDAAVAREVLGWVSDHDGGPVWLRYVEGVGAADTAWIGDFWPSTDPRAMMEAKLYCARNYGMAVTVITDQCGTICTVTHGAATYSSGVKNPQERECRAVCEGLLRAVRAKKGEGE